MNAKVFYWTVIKWVEYKIFKEVMKQPTKEQFQNEYKIVLDAESPIGSLEVEIPEYYFERINLEPEEYIVPLPEGVYHTSMSIGDIVVIDNKRAYICAPIGWEKMEDFCTDWLEEEKNMYPHKDTDFEELIIKDGPKEVMKDKKCRK